MMENIIAATGGLPQPTGNIETDYRELRRFLERMLHVMERNFDTINEHMLTEEGGT